MSDMLAAVPSTWTFDNADVAGTFESHVRSQLPFYDILSEYVVNLATSFLPKNGVLIDVGASTGNITRRLKSIIEEKGVKAISIEPSIEMAAHWAGVGELITSPAQSFDYDEAQPDVVIFYLCLMFLPVAERSDYLRAVIQALQPGGAIIIVDKGFINLPYLQIASKVATLAAKLERGTTPEAYATKELSLRGIQRPINRWELSKLTDISNLVSEEFFRFGEFFGTILVKPAV